VSFYYSNSRRRRESNQKKRRWQKFFGDLVTYAVMGFCLCCVGFWGRVWFTNRQQLTATPVANDSSPTKTKQVPDVAPGYARFNPKCKPEREGIVRQLEDVLKPAREMDQQTPVYIRQKVGDMLADIDNGKVCVYSEQTVEVIVPRTVMEVYTNRLIVYLHVLSPGEVDFRYNVLLSLVHERLHIEDSLPSTLESYISGDIAVRKRVCDNAVQPLIDAGLGKSIPFDFRDDCSHYHNSEREWEEEIAKRYTENWNLFHKYRSN
jgi:hypothetical protein